MLSRHSAILICMDASEPKHRWFRPKPGWLVIFSLAVTGVLFLSERFQWFGFNHAQGLDGADCCGERGGGLLLMLVWWLAALVCRLRFQFSISSLLVLALAVALPSSWLAVELKKAGNQTKALQEIKKFGGLVAWDALQRKPHPQVVERLRSVLGDDFFANPMQVYLADTPATDADLRCLGGLPKLKYLTLSGMHFTDLVLAITSGG